MLFLITLKNAFKIVHKLQKRTKEYQRSDRIQIKCKIA